MISSSRILGVMTGLYLLGFFTYLFLPLVFMSVVAFNQSDIPQTVPWNGFTFAWFAALFRMTECGRHSAIPLLWLWVFISPAMNALGVAFIMVTIFGAVMYEILRRKESF